MALRPLSTPPETTEANSSVTSAQPELYSGRRASSGEIYRKSSFSLRQRAASNTFTKKNVAVRFRDELDMERVYSPSASEDEGSIAGSDLTDGTADLSPRRTKRRRRLPRKSTRYAVAQPAPQLRTKQRHLFQIRPRVLLQLQEIGDRRAIPAFDLVPSHLVVGTLILPKLVKRFPRIFHANSQLGQNDVLLVRSDDYGSAPTGFSTLLSSDGRGAHHDKDVCAVISALPTGCGELAEIVMDDGSSWVASVMANGSYEFTSVDQDGETTTARWVRRSITGARNSFLSTEQSSAKAGLQDSAQDPRWTFSMIDPSSRRHPIMGSLTPEILEVYEDYTTLSTSSGRFPPSRFSSPDVTGSGRQSYPAGVAADSRGTIQVRHEQKALIIATASWIRLHQQGWPESSNPKLAKAIPSNCRSLRGTSRSNIRRQTFPQYDEKHPSAASRPDSSDEVQGSSLSRPQCKAGPPIRAMSTGRAFMKQRRKRLQEITTFDDQETPLPEHQPEKLKAKEAEKTNCLIKMRQWTNRLFHKRKEVS
ncbi:hypothetical protein E4U42_007109 [Claviceps africana]|uniref:Uncharacterized protein n=1 Tax=Claviceps africana TaxID=83212 RepID=A0A8K0NFB5_9HYPO|nr:hypothetical protein E4U42_007109 [Claviceps africana]